MPPDFDFSGLQDSAPAQPQKANEGFDFSGLDSNGGQPTPDKSGFDFSGLHNNDDKYSSIGQQIGTGLEGAAQGVLGPLATAGETALSKIGFDSLSPEEQLNRRQANPNEFLAGETAGLVGGAYTGIGEAGLLARGLGEIPEGVSVLSKIGSMALKGAISSGLIQGSDEISKTLLGAGDPTAAVSNVLTNGALGLLTGGIFGAAGQGASKGLTAIENSKLGTKFTSMMAGLGHSLRSAEPMIGEPATEAQALTNIPDAENINPKWFKVGQKLHDILLGDLGTKAKYAVAGVGLKVGGLPGEVIGYQAGKLAEKAVNENMSRTSSKYIGPFLIKMLSSENVQGLSEGINYINALSNGNDALNKGIENVFRSGSSQALDFKNSERDRKKLKDFIEKGGVDSQIKDQSQNPAPSFAAGGQVKPIEELDHSNVIADHYPEQNILLNTARGRISGYLNSIRPLPNQQKLPYDSTHKDPIKERQYDEAVDLANQPLRILKHVKDGTLISRHMQAFTSMYPELHSEISKRLTKKIVTDQMKEVEKKPPYHVRQAMSLFMGSNLDSSFLPQNITAAQGVFAAQKAQQQVPAKKSENPSKIAEQTMTPEQSRTARLNKS